MRLLGLDYGSKTMGVAISDEGKIIASPRETIRYNSEEELFAGLDKYFHQYEIEGLVLGNPKNLDGSLSTRSENTLVLKEKLENRYHVNVYMEDERYTSVIVNNMLIDNNTRRENRKQVVDKLAASLILQSYLDRSNNGK